MCMIPRRPRPRKPLHPAECDIADKFRKLQAALETRLEYEGDPDCIVCAQTVDEVLVSVRGWLQAFAPEAEPADVCAS